jgi:hypothetical protein
MQILTESHPARAKRSGRGPSLLKTAFAVARCPSVEPEKNSIERRQLRGGTNRRARPQRTGEHALYNVQDDLQAGGKQFCIGLATKVPKPDCGRYLLVLL